MQRRLAALGATAILSLALMPATSAFAKPPSWVPPEGPPPITDPGTCKPGQKNCTAVDTSGPVITAPTVLSGSWFIQFSANEPLDPTSVSVSDFVLTLAETAVIYGNPGISSAVVNSTDPTKIDVRFWSGSQSLEIGDTVTLLAGSVADMAGNTGPAEDVSLTVQSNGDTVAPEVVRADVVNPYQVRFTMSEVIQLTTGQIDDFDYTGAWGWHAKDSVVDVTDGPDYSVINVYFYETGPTLDPGDTVTLLANRVRDLNVNTGPTSDYTFTVPPAAP